MDIALLSLLIILSCIVSIVITTTIIYLLYWIAQFFKQKAITEQQKNKKGEYKHFPWKSW